MRRKIHVYVFVASVAGNLVVCQEWRGQYDRKMGVKGSQNANERLRPNLQSPPGSDRCSMPKIEPVRLDSRD